MVEGLTSTATDRSVGGCGSHRRRRRRRPREIAVRASVAPRERGHADGFHWIRDPGDSSGEATPVPIPNTEVKLSSAENTERAAFREDRSSPGSLFDSRRVTPGHRATGEGWAGRADVAGAGGAARPGSIVDGRRRRDSPARRGPPDGRSGYPAGVTDTPRPERRGPVRDPRIRRRPGRGPPPGPGGAPGADAPTSSPGPGLRRRVGGRTSGLGVRGRGGPLAAGPSRRAARVRGRRPAGRGRRRQP